MGIFEMGNYTLIGVQLVGEMVFQPIKDPFQIDFEP